MTQASRNNHSPTLIAIAGWILPGAGYALLGQKSRAIVVGATIITLFLSGMLLAGVRVIDVPGYDRFGNQVKIRPDGTRVEFSNHDEFYDRYRWAVLGRGLLAEMVNKPWYVCQILTGPICLISSEASISAAQHGIPSSHARIFEIGTLYTAVAGLLNLLVIIDCGHRASKRAEVRQT